MHRSIDSLSRARAAATVAVLVLASAPAQQQPPSPVLPKVAQPTAKGSGKARVFDEVIGIIGDRVILQSAIDRELEDRFVDRKMTAQERELEKRRIMFAIARDEVWVQYGKVLGQQAPDAFEEAVQHHIDAYMQEEQNRYGSFTRMTEELESIGSSYQSVQESYRNKLLSDIARNQALGNRVRDKIPLLVTPREMLRYFKKNRRMFEASSVADIAWVSFPTRDDPEGTVARAQEAAEAWRRPPAAGEVELDERDLAQRFNGIPLPPSVEIRPDDPEDSRADFLKTFAAEQPEGTVSDPILRGTNYLVLKLVLKVDRAERKFTDPLVQSEIRNLLADQKMQVLHGRILVRNSQKLLVWPEWLLQPR